jgi:Ulp1 family protease
MISDEQINTLKRLNIYEDYLNELQEIEKKFKIFYYNTTDINFHYFHILIHAIDLFKLFGSMRKFYNSDLEKYIDSVQNTRSNKTLKNNYKQKNIKNVEIIKNKDILNNQEFQVFNEELTSLNFFEKKKKNKPNSFLIFFYMKCAKNNKYNEIKSQINENIQILKNIKFKKRNREIEFSKMEENNKKKNKIISNLEKENKNNLEKILINNNKNNNNNNNNNISKIISNNLNNDNLIINEEKINNNNNNISKIISNNLNNDNLKIKDEQIIKDNKNNINKNEKKKEIDDKFSINFDKKLKIENTLIDENLIISNNDEIIECDEEQKVFESEDNNNSKINLKLFNDENIINYCFDVSKSVNEVLVDTICRWDFLSLKDNNFVNDGIVNEFIKFYEIKDKKLIINSQVINFLNPKNLKIEKFNNYLKKKNFNTFNKIFIVLNKNKHWILFYGNGELKKKYILDSLGSSKNYENDFNIIYEKINEFYNNLMKDWKYSYDIDYPKQTHGYDCGIFVMKYLEYLAVNKKFDFTINDIKDFRKKILLQLIKFK